MHLAMSKLRPYADKQVHEYIPRYVAPEMLHSDQGRNLNAKWCWMFVTFFKRVRHVRFIRNRMMLQRE